MTTDSDQPPGRLSRMALARAVRVQPETIGELLEWGFLQPDGDGMFRPSDIQRVRAVMAMRSPGIELEQLIETFRERLFTLQPMDLLYPEPAIMSDTTPGELAASLKITEHELSTVMVAAGFPAPVSGSPMREDDADLARSLVTAAHQLGGSQLAARVARAYGDAARRAAESGVAMFAENVNSPVVNARIDDEQRMEVNRIAAELMASSEVLLGRLYRRHLEHTLLRQWASSAETYLDQLGIRPARPRADGVAFVDLTGYTAITEQTGDTTAVQLAERLGTLADDAAAEHHGRVVKLLGDGAMLHFNDGLSAVRGALALVDLVAASNLPTAHAGVHAGPVIERDGDYFGRTVNLASRISSQAAPGQVLVSEEIARLTAEDVDFALAGSRQAKGVGAVILFQARWRGQAGRGSSDRSG